MTAINNADNNFELTPFQIITEVLDLKEEHFYKAMKSDYYEFLWHDVYHKPITSNDIAYIKIQVDNDESVIIQFKRK